MVSYLRPPIKNRGSTIVINFSHLLVAFQFVCFFWGGVIKLDFI